MATNNAANESTAGIQSLTTAGVFNGRTITGTANQISVSNGDGTAGNPTLSLTSTIQVTGISFDSGSNTLSAYSTGTFTPTVDGGSGSPTITYTTQVGIYEKIGLKVIFNALITVNTISGGTGNCQIGALPFTSLSTSNSVSTGPVSLGTITFGASVLYYQHQVQTNTTFSILTGVRSASTVLALAIGGVAAASQFRWSGAYNI